MVSCTTKQSQLTPTLFLQCTDVMIAYIDCTHLDGGIVIKYTLFFPDFDYQCMTVLLGASGKCELELVDIIGVSTSS